MDIQPTFTAVTATNQAASSTDSELVARVREGEIDAFEIIMRRHNQRL
jgi:hypothetical protein